MKILQAVTYLGEGGAFGGPARVCLNQSVALASSGHDVRVLSTDSRASTDETEGVIFHRLRGLRLPGLGFSGILAPALWRESRPLLAEVDVAHVHLARDLVTLPLARMALHHGVPLVIQMHGMIAQDTRWQAKVLDRLLTSTVVRMSSVCLVLTPGEHASVEALRWGARCTTLPNGVPVDEASARGRVRARQATVAFVGRFHPVKRPDAFVAAAELLLRDQPTLNFVMVGSDGGSLLETLGMIEAKGLRDRIRYLGSASFEEADQVVRNADVIVIPSVSEVFSMTMLEALAAGTPVVVGDQNDLASLLPEGARRQTDGSPAGLAEGVAEVLAPRAWKRYSLAGVDAIAASYDIRMVAARLLEQYAAAVSSI